MAHVILVLVIGYSFEEGNLSLFSPFDDKQMQQHLIIDIWMFLKVEMNDSTMLFE